MLELLAVFRGLTSAESSVQGQVVLVSSDNTTVVAFINRQGGTHSIRLCLLTRELLLWCHARHISLRARHIAGRKNVLADYLSRQSAPVLTEWSLHPSVCSAVLSRWGDPFVDLFATSLNHRLALFVSPVPDLRAWAVDAMSLSWALLDGYAFPPFVMLPRVLRKIRQDRARITLVAPCWPTRSWFVTLLELLTELPIVLPARQDLLSQHAGQTKHRNVRMLNLHAWRLSGRPLDVKAFQTALPKSSLGVSVPPPPSYMMRSGGPGLIGAINGRLIRSTPL